MIKCAEKSPRICNDGSIRWYEGDTFELEFNLNFTDDNGDPVPTAADDKIEICIRDKISNKSVYETAVVGTNKLIISIDENATKNFTVGEYYYCVKRNSNYITTIMRKNKIVVE